MAVGQTVTNPPSGSKPYGTPIAVPDGKIMVGRTGSYTYITPLKYTDSLLALGYTKHQVDSIISFDYPIVQGEKRKATFAFIFDDGLASDANVVSKFDSIGWRVGFALITNNVTESDKTRYLGYQRKGYEILSHSKSHVRFDNSTTLSPTQARNDMRGSLDSLRKWGFNTTGWVTPFSQMKPDFVEILKDYYQYGFTTFFGVVNPPNEDNSYHTFDQELRGLWRVSIESSSESDVISAIDACIEAGGFMVFYAHTYPSTTIPQAKLTAITNHLKSYVDNSQADILTPSQALRKYYHMGHEQIVSELANRVRLDSVNQMIKGVKGFNQIRVSDYQVFSDPSWGFEGLPYGETPTYTALTEADNLSLVSTRTEAFAFANTSEDWPQLLAISPSNLHHINSKKFFSGSGGMQWAYPYGSLDDSFVPVFRFFSASGGATNWQRIATENYVKNNFVDNYSNQSDISGVKGWVGAHRWVGLTTAPTAVPNTLMIAGNGSGQYIQSTNPSGTPSFTIRGYGGGGANIQLTLADGGASVNSSWTPTSSNHVATKGYVDGAGFAVSGMAATQVRTNSQLDGRYAITAGTPVFTGNYVKFGNQTAIPRPSSANNEYSFLIYRSSTNSWPGPAIEGRNVNGDAAVIIRTFSDTGVQMRLWEGGVDANGAYTNTSDSTLKNDAEYDYSGVGNIPARAFTWKDGRDSLIHVRYYAQEVEEYLPNAVRKNEDTGKLSVDESQVLIAKVSLLEQKNAELEALLQALTARIEALENKEE
ncbi:polysaccharide deacetylase family protein [Parapedobacter lycopersici]|uniref:polysaccharide deacetylase family protein n=1 Tax=Parapedobacter lycopersici TaxID=1864939 RepID=UPI00214D88B9|nr:polysaccharide deacetylase family protein [Parapedobacter lycopersici]